MWLLSVISTLVALTGAARAIAVSSPDVVEKLDEVPPGWAAVGVPDAEKRVNLRIAMTVDRQTSVLEQILYNISSPDSSNYGVWLTHEQVEAMMRPDQEATESVLRWLRDNDVPSSDIKDNGDSINFSTTIGQASELLDSRFEFFRSERSGNRVVRTLQYSVPLELHQYIDFVDPVTMFFEWEHLGRRVFDYEVLDAAQQTANLTNCNVTITPACLKELYNITEIHVDNKTSGFAAFSNFLEQYPRRSDLEAFNAKYAPYAKGNSFTWSSIHGGDLNQTSAAESIEANLDAQYLMAMAKPVPVHAYSTGGRGKLVPDEDQPDLKNNGNEPYLEYLTRFLSLPDDELPTTLSNSYGENEQSVPEQYSRAVCKMFAQLGARGVSVIFSSGDEGVGSACETNDGNNTARFLPIFPASCPWVTSVGGTYQIKPEKAWSSSSGGFSDLFPRPAYQDAAVKQYLSTIGNKWEVVYNPAGRGFPDVVAQAVNYHVVDKGLNALVKGTSASAPTFAGIIALLNAARLQAGKPTLSFLNPWIYSEGYRGLTDIVDGGSDGCHGYSEHSGLATKRIPYASWNATKGWDPVTGYGTPDFRKLLELAMQE